MQRDVRVRSSPQRRRSLLRRRHSYTARRLLLLLLLLLYTLASSASHSLPSPPSPRWCITSFFIDCRRGTIALSRFRTTRVVRFVFYPALLCIVILLSAQSGDQQASIDFFSGRESHTVLS